MNESHVPSGRSGLPLYWQVQGRRNANLLGLFVVVLVFLAAYGFL